VGGRVNAVARAADGFRWRRILILTYKIEKLRRDFRPIPLSSAPSLVERQRLLRSWSIQAMRSCSCVPVSITLTWLLFLEKFIGYALLSKTVFRVYYRQDDAKSLMI
jgi:hypothetical protein